VEANLAQANSRLGSFDVALPQMLHSRLILCHTWFILDRRHSLMGYYFSPVAPSGCSKLWLRFLAVRPMFNWMHPHNL
jgi:hypothetical protein